MKTIYFDHYCFATIFDDNASSAIKKVDLGRGWPGDAVKRTGQLKQTAAGRRGSGDLADGSTAGEANGTGSEEGWSIATMLLAALHLGWAHWVVTNLLVEGGGHTSTTIDSITTEMLGHPRMLRVCFAALSLTASTRGAGCGCWPVGLWLGTVRVFRQIFAL